MAGLGVRAAADFAVSWATGHGALKLGKVVKVKESMGINCMGHPKMVVHVRCSTCFLNP